MDVFIIKYLLRKPIGYNEGMKINNSVKIVKSIIVTSLVSMMMFGAMLTPVNQVLAQSSEKVIFQTESQAIMLIQLVNQANISQTHRVKLIQIIFSKLINTVDESDINKKEPELPLAAVLDEDEASQRTYSGDQNCDDFSSQAEAQDYFESKGGDEDNNVDGLDRDRDGEACENNSY